MTELLQLPELIDQHRMTEMEIGRSRVEPRFDAHRLAAYQSLLELCFDEQLIATATDDLEFLFEGCHGQRISRSGTLRNIRLPATVILLSFRPERPDVLKTQGNHASRPAYCSRKAGSARPQQYVPSHRP